MNAAVVRRTQEALGKVIRRPPLTEKLLSKPPFRYLHDIITEVIRMTGFMKGLYTDAEMKSDNVKDKDSKISFLQKAIDVVVLVSGEPLAVKPARVVAGHEPERTNELLQRIGRCCLGQLSSEDAVKRVLAGEKDTRGRAALTAKPQESDGRNSRDEEPRVPRDKEGAGTSEVQEGSASRDRRQRELKEEAKPSDKEKAGEDGRDRQRDPERDRGREGERERARARARTDRDRDSDRARERRSEGGRARERWKDREKERERDKGGDRDRDRRRAKNGERARDPGRERNREQDKPDKKSSGSGEVSKKSSDGLFRDSRAEAETEASPRASGSVTAKTSRRRSRTSGEGPKDAAASSARVSDGGSAGLWRDSPEPEPAVRQKEGDVGPAGQDKPQGPEEAEVPVDLPPDTRRLPRPGSARPAPPRVKRQDSAEVLAADRTGSGKAAVSNVIVDAQISEDEDDQFVVEAAPQLPEAPEHEGAQAVELEEEEKHGGLVTKILETKRDYETLRLPPRPGGKEKSLVSESAWKKEKDVVSKEIEKLRVSIQTLCKSALPLGKIMDYLQEDVDTMQNELQLWRSESRQHAQALRREQSITDSAVEPLRAELAELEQLIRDQQDRICAVKASILKNEEKIQKMVYGLTLSSRR